MKHKRIAWGVWMKPWGAWARMGAGIAVFESRAAARTWVYNFVSFKGDVAIVRLSE